MQVGRTVDLQLCASIWVHTSLTKPWSLCDCSAQSCRHAAYRLFQGPDYRCGFAVLPTFGVQALQWTWHFDFQQQYIGAGMLVPHVVAWSMMLGAVLSWGVLWPLLAVSACPHALPSISLFNELANIHAAHWEDLRQALFRLKHRDKLGGVSCLTPDKLLWCCKLSSAEHCC